MNCDNRLKQIKKYMEQNAVNMIDIKDILFHQHNVPQLITSIIEDKMISMNDKIHLIKQAVGKSISESPILYHFCQEHLDEIVVTNWNFKVTELQDFLKNNGISEKMAIWAERTFIPYMEKNEVKVSMNDLISVCKFLKTPSSVNSGDVFAGNEPAVLEQSAFFRKIDVNVRSEINKYIFQAIKNHQMIDDIPSYNFSLVWAVVKNSRNYG